MSRERTPLIALDNVSVATAAGINGLGFCTVRILDSVSLSIFRGDMVLLRGSRDHASATLLRILAADARLARLTSGTRDAHPALIVRDGVVPAHAILPIMNAWTDAAPSPLPRAFTPARRIPNPIVYLLRASERVESFERGVEDWSYWSASLRRQGGTIVIAERKAADDDVVARELRFQVAVDPAPTRAERLWYDDRAVEPHTVHMVRETALSCHCRQPVVRIVHLDFGRVTSERIQRQPPCSRCRAVGVH